MPAVLSGIASAIYAWLATKEAYRNDLFDIYPARMELNSSMSIEQNSTYIMGVTLLLFCFYIYGIEHHRVSYNNIILTPLYILRNFSQHFIGQ